MYHGEHHPMIIRPRNIPLTEKCELEDHSWTETDLARTSAIDQYSAERKVHSRLGTGLNFPVRLQRSRSP